MNFNSTINENAHMQEAQTEFGFLFILVALNHIQNNNNLMMKKYQHRSSNISVRCVCVCVCLFDWCFCNKQSLTLFSLFFWRPVFIKPPQQFIESIKSQNIIVILSEKKMLT